MQAVSVLVQHSAQIVRGGKRNCSGCGRNAAACGNEKSDDERALLFVSSYIFDCRSRDRFVTRVYAVQRLFSLFVRGLIKRDITRLIVRL